MRQENPGCDQMPAVRPSSSLWALLNTHFLTWAMKITLPVSQREAERTVWDEVWPEVCGSQVRNPCSGEGRGLRPWTSGSGTDSSSRWCHPTISSSVVPFSSGPQSFPASGSFQMSQLFASGGQSIGVSASTSVLPMNTQDWSPLGWTIISSKMFSGPFFSSSSSSGTPITQMLVHLIFSQSLCGYPQFF